eukprot:6473514-Amphidinium_carterae.1
MASQCKSTKNYLEGVYCTAQIVHELDVLTQQAYPSHWNDLRDNASELWLTQKYSLEALQFGEPSIYLTEEHFWTKANHMLEQTKGQPFLHVMELFGGHGGVTKCALRFRLNAGLNVDLTTGFDVLLPRVRQQLWQYVHRRKPTLV